MVQRKCISSTELYQTRHTYYTAQTESTQSIQH